MRRNGRGRIVLTMTVLCMLCAATAMSAEKVYINGIDGNFPPFSYLDRSGNPDGLDVKALDWIAREMKFKVRHRSIDWDEIISSLEAKKIDIIASGMSMTEERKGLVNFSIPYWRIKEILVAKKDAKLTAEKALSEGNKIGVQRSTIEAKWIEETLLKKEGKKFELVLYDSVLRALEDVVAGRIAAVAMDDVLALDAAKKMPVKVLGGFGMQDDVFGYAVRKEDTEFLAKVNEGLKKLMKSPYWTELKRTYIGKR